MNKGSITVQLPLFYDDFTHLVGGSKNFDHILFLIRIITVANITISMLLFIRNFSGPLHVIGVNFISAATDRQRRKHLSETFCIVLLLVEFLQLFYPLLKRTTEILNLLTFVRQFSYERSRNLKT